MLIKEVLGADSDIIDNKDGLGSVPKNQEVDYFGMRVLMKPSKFLQLAAPGDKPESTERIAQHLRDGGKKCY